MAQVVKNLLVMQKTQEMWVVSLGQEDPLEEEMAIHSSIFFSWKIPQMEERGGLKSIGSQRVGHDGACDGWMDGWMDGQMDG